MAECSRLNSLLLSSIIKSPKFSWKPSHSTCLLSRWSSHTPFETYYREHMREGSRQAYLWRRLKIQEHRHSGRQRKEGACCTHLPLLMRGLFLRHTQHNAHTMQRENKRHRSHISDGWWTKFSTCQTCYIWSAHGKMGLSPLCSSDAPLSPNLGK